MATILTKAEFIEKVADYENNNGEWKFKGTRPAVIDFFATWCGPCRALSPLIDEASETYAGKIDVYKIDVDAEPELAGLFGIRSIPSLLFIPMNGEPRMSVGALPRTQLKEQLEALLA
ncbi:MAG: thioredoxin [Marinilabiliaceae bacterium]|nr:thioredoxin [Marinilabiliaceae bacterium]